MLALIPDKDPSPIAFLDVFEDGDRWDKIQGCEVCPEETRAKCCGDCYHLVKGALCRQHLVNTKPWGCIIKPNPNSVKGDCSLEYKCVQGGRKGQIRRVQDRRGIFV